MPLTPEEQRELDDLEFQKLEHERSLAGVKDTPAAPTPAAEPQPSPNDQLGALSETGWDSRQTQEHNDRREALRSELKAVGWENMGAMDRMELMYRAYPEYVTKELTGGGALTVRAAGPAIGQKLGQATRTPFMDRVFGAIFGAGSEILAEKMDNEKFSGGKILAAAFGGAQKGRPMAGATGREVAKEAGQMAGLNVGAKAVETVVDEQRLPTAGEASRAAAGGAMSTVAGKAVEDVSGAVASLGRNAPAQALTEELRKAGYVFVPSKMGARTAGDVADTLGGASPNKSALANVLTLKNAEATNDLARKYIKVPLDMPLDEPHMAALITTAEEPYRRVAGMSPQASANLEIYRQANSDSKKLWKANDRLPQPEIEKLAKYQDQLADMALDELTNEARALGRPQLVPQLEKARVELAKLHLVDRAINYGDYNVSAKVFKNAKDHGALLTDEADLIARMYAAHPGIMGDVSSVTTVGGSKLPLVGAAVRAVTSSNPVQNAITRPPVPPQGTAATAARTAVATEARD